MCNERCQHSTETGSVLPNRLGGGKVALKEGRDVSDARSIKAGARGEGHRRLERGPKLAPVMETDDLRFVLKGEIRNASSDHLDGSASDNQSGRLYVFSSAFERRVWPVE